MKCVYPTLIAKHEDDFLVFVPDMDIYTEGKTFADAIEMARDAIGLKGIDYEDDNKAIPEPSTAEHAIAIAKKDPEIFDYSQGTLTYVDVNFSEYRKAVDTRTVRRNVTLPCWLNNEADKAGVNVSGILQEALIKALNVSRPY